MRFFQKTLVAVSPRVAASAGYRRTNDQKFLRAFQVGIWGLISGWRERINQKFIFLSRRASLSSFLQFMLDKSSTAHCAPICGKKRALLTETKALRFRAARFCCAIH